MFSKKFETKTLQPLIMTLDQDAVPFSALHSLTSKFACLSHLKYSSKGTPETLSYTLLSSYRLTREDSYCKICWGIRNVEIQANVSAVNAKQDLNVYKN